MEYVDVRVAMVTLLLSVAALVVVFVLMLRKQKRMYVAQLEENEKHRVDLINKYLAACREKKDADEKILQLKTEADRHAKMYRELHDKRIEQYNTIAELTEHRNQLLEANKELQDRCNMYVNMVAEREKEIEQQKEQLADTQNILEDVKKDRGDTFIRYLRVGADLKEAKAEIFSLKKQLSVQKGVITKLRKKLNVNS